MSENFLRAELDKPTAPPFALSAIRRIHSNWRYLWPFRSGRALLMIGLQGGATLSPLVVILLWFDLVAFVWVLAAVLVCSIYMAFYPVLPARMTITTRGEACNLADEMKLLLMSTGYLPGNAVGNTIYEVGHVYFYPSLFADPYLDSTEQEIDLYCRGNKIELCGPLNMIKFMKKKVASLADEEAVTFSTRSVMPSRCAFRPRL